MHASAHGEHYSYTVEKFWTVKEVHDDGQITVVTRTGKEHLLKAEDPRLRKPGVIDRVRYKDRFPTL